MHPKTNPQLELAYEYVCHTNKSIFLTGKAGTGKTTFLHRIKEEAPKRLAVVAPTGVAAINARGMTIHSFFQLPFGPYLPGNAREVARQRRFSGEKIKLIRNLDLLIIDEISMVRADLLDGIDEVLRRYKHPYQPFGGVQLLMIGDLHQLPPVVKDEEWELLRAHYDTPYFFSSQALKQAKPATIELKHIYRQSDSTFISLLNKVRNNEIDTGVLATLNSRYLPDKDIKEEDAYITLTTHNASAHQINAQKLAAIPGEAHRFKAEVSGDFPAHAYPADELLELKAGAQVMFIKNDLGPEKRFYNGKIGKVTRIDEEEVVVLCPGEAEEIVVSAVEWMNVKYTLNEQAKEVQEDIVGTFTQYPLRLAWAITIHKSQGLTFERVLLDAQAAFAHGQVYVALSRCKSFEGLVLRSKINYSSIRTDTTVKNFTEAAEKNAPDEAQLEKDKAAFQQSLLLELFSFSTLKQYLEGFNRILLEHEGSLHPGAAQQFQTLTSLVQDQVFPVEEAFRRQLLHLSSQGGLPEENEALQSRVQKASTWFAEKLEVELMPAAKNIQIITDNRKVRKVAMETLENLQKELFAKQACFTASQKGFATQHYLNTRMNAELDFQKAQRTAAPTIRPEATPQNTPQPELYAQLEAWRKAAAEDKGVAPYMILPAQSLLGLVQVLPQNTAQLKKVHGIGKRRINQHGAELLAIIEHYCRAHQIQPASNPVLEEAVAVPKAPKPDTKAVSLQLFQSGKSIEEIAAERGLVRTTIEGHLAHFIGLGQLSVFDLIAEEEVQKIAAYLTANPDGPLSEARAYFEEAYSYGQIKMVVEYLRSLSR
ncbi:MAG: helix-turn-helix domain-containing protein [Phaeodactylibacter sp.]|nr:helix-turn-helix domain-containing protein [Phaeodactylibacter sp.]